VLGTHSGANPRTAECYAVTARLDPVTLEVIRNALPAVANEMAADLQRTSCDMSSHGVRDFCTALVSTECELSCQKVRAASHCAGDLGVLSTAAMRR